MAYGDRHLQRESNRGPVAGAYQSFTLQAASVAAGQTDLYIGEIKLPSICRVMEIAAGNLTSVGGASRGTFQVTDGTNDLIDVDKLMTSADSVIVTPTSATSKLVAAQRTRAKGDKLKLFVTTVAAEVVTSLTVTITVWVQDHVVADEAND